MDSDTELNDARARMIRAEYTIGAGVQDEEMGPLLVRALESKLQADRHSKMAFEYLMAHYLLTGQLDKVVANIPRLSDLGYRDIPRHYQEAILLHASTHPDADPQLDRISSQTLDNFKAYIQVLARFRNDKSAANRELMKTHDRSYFLYYTVGFSDSRFAAMSNQTGAPR